MGCDFDFAMKTEDGREVGGQMDQLDRVLRGANPAVLPIQQPTLSDIVINMHKRQIQTIGLTVPQAVLAQAPEVIE